VADRYGSTQRRRRRSAIGLMFVGGAERVLIFFLFFVDFFAFAFELLNLIFGGVVGRGGAAHYGETAPWATQT